MAERLAAGGKEGSVKLSAVIPVHNGGEDLRRCIEALAASSRVPDEIIVVDDSSSDSSATMARAMGAQVFSVPDGPHGPAVCRNRGAAAAQGDVLVFIDADVVVHPDTLAMIVQHMANQPEIAAIFGSYDDSPPRRGVVTLYKNLLHHYVHQHSRREASTFWAGCGAIRRDVFMAIGGFDESYRRPSIEDIELGTRLRQAGHRIWLCSDVQVTHLKAWKLHSLLRADIFYRAIPWTRLILSNAPMPSDLNLDTRSRISAIVAWSSLALLVLGFWFPWTFVGTALTVAALGFLNVDLYRFFARRGGLRFAVGAFGLHALYFLYSSLVFGSILMWHSPRRAGIGTNVSTSHGIRPRMGQW